MPEVFFPQGPGRPRVPGGAGGGIAGYGDSPPRPAEEQARHDALVDAIITALSKLAGVPVKLQTDGWPPFGAVLFDRRTAIAGVAPTAAFVRIVSFGPINQRNNGYFGSFGIGLSDSTGLLDLTAEKANLSWRIDLPDRLVSPDWQQVNQLQVTGFPRGGCCESVNFPLQGGETIGLSVRYTAGAVPAGLVVHARVRGWTWLPRLYDPTSYRGRPE